MGSFNELNPFLNEFCSGDRRWNRLERGQEGDRKGEKRKREEGRKEEERGRKKGRREEGKRRDEKREENLNH